MCPGVGVIVCFFHFLQCYVGVYLGGGDIESQREQGQSIGIGAGNVYNFTPDSRAVDAVYQNMSKGVARRRDVLFKAGAPAAAAASLLDDDEVKDLITSK